jgi:hypothetical protein
MDLRPDPKCQHNNIRGGCSKCKRGVVPTSGTMVNGRLVKQKKTAKKKPRSGWARSWGG